MFVWEKLINPTALFLGLETSVVKRIDLTFAIRAFEVRSQHIQISCITNDTLEQKKYDVRILLVGVYNVVDNKINFIHNFIWSYRQKTRAALKCAPRVRAFGTDYPPFRLTPEVFTF